MDGALGWISEIIHWFGRFIPRLVIVRATHAGVRFRRGRDAYPVPPGLHIYWPLCTEMEVIPVARQTHNLPSQALLTRDGKRVVAGGVVVYRITDIVAAISRNWDVSDTLNDISMLAITEVVTTHDLAHLLEHLTDDVQQKLTHVTRKRLRQYGVQVYRAFLTDFSECLIIRNIGGGGLLLGHNME